MRNINDYGSIDDYIVELAISLDRDFRGYGIRIDMMRRMLHDLVHGGYRKVSLMIQKDNYALKVHLKIGFEIVDENDDEYIMIHHLQNVL